MYWSFSRPEVESLRFEANRAVWGKDLASDAKSILVEGYPIYGFRSGDELRPVVRADIVDYYGNIMETDSTTVLYLKAFTYPDGRVDSTVRGNDMAVVHKGMHIMPWTPHRECRPSEAAKQTSLITPRGP